MRHKLILSCFVSTLSVAAMFAPATAWSQSVLVLVNGEPVTSYDVEQRMKIAAALDRKPISRAQSLEEVINDRLKTQEARRIGYRISDEDVDAQFAKLAQGVRQPIPQFEKNLRSVGIQPNAVKSKTKADIAWQTIMQQRMKRGASITNADVDNAASEKAKKSGAKTIEYKLQQVVFVVPSGSGGAVLQRRQSEAAGSKGKFQGCNEGGFQALGKLNDVAVKEPINRSSEALSEGANKLLSKTPIGGVAGPLATPEGFELIAVCGKVEREDIAGLRSSAETELFGKKATAESDALLKEIKSKAAIERRK